MFRVFRWLAMPIAACLLAACSSGGGATVKPSSSPPVSVVVTPSPAPSRLPLVAPTATMDRPKLYTVTPVADEATGEPEATVMSVLVAATKAAPITTAFYGGGNVRFAIIQRGVEYADKTCVPTIVYGPSVAYYSAACENTLWLFAYPGRDSLETAQRMLVAYALARAAAEGRGMEATRNWDMETNGLLSLMVSGGQLECAIADRLKLGHRPLAHCHPAL